MFRYLSIIILAVWGATCCQAQTPAVKLSAKEFADKIKSTPGAQVVDVRTPSEFKAGHIKDASNVDISSGEFKNMAAAIDKSKPVFVYCLSGGRSASAARYLTSQGYNEVYEMTGGMMEWRNNNLPEVKLTVTSEGMSVAEYEAMLQSGKVVLVDFYAEWCAPCKKMKPYLENIAKDKTATVIRIDADQNSRLCKALGISGLPVIKVYRNGKESWNHTGFVDEEGLRKQLE
ncbi:thioredoxin domain-containing protein [Leadbetterella sp. DM7]|uniref:thioredoxin domain-containing protein n=1 Tax=Leadbetterella sp. DM7 TaxID=3235085 RepID=UPI00349EEB11